MDLAAAIETLRRLAEQPERRQHMPAVAGVPMPKYRLIEGAARFQWQNFRTGC
jgi:hypothetical protein